MSRETRARLRRNFAKTASPSSIFLGRAYAIYAANERTVTLRRLEYPIARTAEDMKMAGLPDVLAARLFHGM